MGFRRKRRRRRRWSKWRREGEKVEEKVTNYENE